MSYSFQVLAYPPVTLFCVDSAVKEASLNTVRNNAFENVAVNWGILG
jgi:hypothetical protein